MAEAYQAPRGKVHWLEENHVACTAGGWWYVGRDWISRGQWESIPEVERCLLCWRKWEARR
jgi:hypothetical protein